MKRKKRADRNYKFTGKKHSIPGAAALVFAFVPLLLFLYAVNVSYHQGGQAAAAIGCVGIAALLVALATLVVAVREVRKDNVFKKIPAGGVIVSLLMLAGWTSVYVCGWMMM